jgi:hypothetical protein
MQGFRGGSRIEVLPLVVIVHAFPARPSSLPDIREFVRAKLTQTPFSEEDIRTLSERVSDMLLDVAGPNGLIHVSLRIFPDHAEVDVLPAAVIDEPGDTGAPRKSVRAESGSGSGDSGAAPLVDSGAGTATRSDGGGSSADTAVPAVRPADPAVRSADPAVRSADRSGGVSFAHWLAGALRREGMTMEAAARQVGVSVKTVSRWVGGTTEPRLRDLSRLREIFGDLPFP